MKKQASQLEIVTIALFSLGGGERVVDTEDIAIAAHRLAPGRFAWRKHPEQVNLELVRVFLSDGKKKGRGWLNGTGNEGWSLTQAGLEWARENSARVAGGVLERQRGQKRGGSVDEQRWRRERVRIQTLAGWSAWLSGVRIISEKDACEVFRIDSYAVGRTRDLKVNRMMEMFHEDAELQPFLAAAARVIT